jgi:hypothetical protein
VSHVITIRVALCSLHHINAARFDDVGTPFAYTLEIAFAVGRNLSEKPLPHLFPMRAIPLMGSSDLRHCWAHWFLGANTAF